MRMIAPSPRSETSSMRKPDPACRETRSTDLPRQLCAFTRSGAACDGTARVRPRARTTNIERSIDTPLFSKARCTNARVGTLVLDVRTARSEYGREDAGESGWPAQPERNQGVPRFG